MFRRLQKKSTNPLELRHQRTCDVCFDFKEHRTSNYKPHEYVYKLIETMLPKSQIDETTKEFRMIELYAPSFLPFLLFLNYCIGGLLTRRREKAG